MRGTAFITRNASLYADEYTRRLLIGSGQTPKVRFEEPTNQYPLNICNRTLTASSFTATTDATTERGSFLCLIPYYGLEECPELASISHVSAVYRIQRTDTRCIQKLLCRVGIVTFLSTQHDLENNTRGNMLIWQLYSSRVARRQAR